MQGNASDIWQVFLYSKEKLKIGPKNSFFLLAFRGFSITPSYALRVTPQFLAKWKVWWRYITLVSFISIAFVVAKLWIFKCAPRLRIHCHSLLKWYKCHPSFVYISLVIPEFFHISKVFLAAESTISGWFGCFWLFFKGFSTTPSYAKCVTPQFFAKSKVWWRYTIVVSIIRMTFVVRKL